MLQKQKKGVLISFIGADFTGKSTLANLLYNHLRQELAHRDIVSTREPGGTEIGAMVREILKTGLCSRMAEMFLFLADRTEHYKKISPLLTRGAIVISDRWYTDSCAYQYSCPEINKNMSFETLVYLNRLAMHNLEPDYLFYCDSSLETIKKRMQERKSGAEQEWGSFEQVDFLAKVIETFEMVLEKGILKTTKLFRVDTNTTTVNSFNQVVDKIKIHNQE